MFFFRVQVFQGLGPGFRSPKVACRFKSFPFTSYIYVFNFSSSSINVRKYTHQPWSFFYRRLKVFIYVMIFVFREVFKGSLHTAIFLKYTELLQLKNIFRIFWNSFWNILKINVFQNKNQGLCKKRSYFLKWR